MLEMAKKIAIGASPFNINTNIVPAFSLLHDSIKDILLNKF